MKRLCLLLLALLLACSFAVAQERTQPADAKEIDTTGAISLPTSFLKYDAKYFESESTQPGTLVRVDYTTEVYGELLNTFATVYLPHGYDPSGTERYNVIYFLHGTNETQDSFIAEPRAKNAIDNMIQAGVTAPFIMVCPSYYYDYETRAIDMANFVREVRQDLMPAVEGIYRTYAETADDAGFVTSREHRAFAGYSRGAYACWHMFFNNLDYAYWYMPFSAPISGEVEMTLDYTPEQQLALIKESLERQAAYKDSFYVYIACGGKRDMMYDVSNALVEAMVADTETFSYGLDKAEHNLYYCVSKEIHQTLMSRFYFFNAFDVVFK